jgi:hypothetical protein
MDEAVMGWGDLPTEFWCDNLRETDRLGDLCEDEKIVLKRIFNKSVELGWWAQQSDRWRPHVDVVINRRV